MKQMLIANVYSAILMNPITERSKDGLNADEMSVYAYILLEHEPPVLAFLAVPMDEDDHARVRGITQKLGVPHPVKILTRPMVYDEKRGLLCGSIQQIMADRASGTHKLA